MPNSRNTHFRNCCSIQLWREILETPALSSCGGNFQKPQLHPAVEATFRNPCSDQLWILHAHSSRDLKVCAGNLPCGPGLSFMILDPAPLWTSASGKLCRRCFPLSLLPAPTGHRPGWCVSTSTEAPSITSCNGRVNCFSSFSLCWLGPRRK